MIDRLQSSVNLFCLACYGGHGAGDAGSGVLVALLDVFFRNPVGEVIFGLVVIGVGCYFVYLG